MPGFGKVCVVVDAAWDSSVSNVVVDRIAQMHNIYYSTSRFSVNRGESMSRRLVSTAALVAGLVSVGFVSLPAAAQTQMTAVAIPDTPAGGVLKAWLDAFNSGDSARITAYYKQYQPDVDADGQIAFRARTGGFDLLSIERTEARHVEFMVKERGGATTAFGLLELGAVQPPQVASFQLLAVPKTVTAADFHIDAAERGHVIDGAIANLSEYYVFPEVAAKMADTMKAHLRRGDYDSVANGMRFAALLTEQLQGVSHDKHLRVNFNPARFPDNSAGPPPGAAARYQQQMASINCGFVKVEMLPGNVGYLKFNLFADPEVCGPTASAAMNFVANANALIVDMRDNGGGDPKMVTYLCSYLFSNRTHINDLWDRKSGTTHEYWTTDSVSGKRLADDKPVYVLTSRRSFSGAEEFTYDLKNQKRATIVGETTGGGAHPVAGRRIDEHFMIGVPGARAINPVTHTNWEGVGVEPDVKVPAADALTTAQKLAADHLAMKEKAN
jgi:hypothetical protein